LNDLLCSTKVMHFDCSGLYRPAKTIRKETGELGEVLSDNE